MTRRRARRTWLRRRLGRGQASEQLSPPRTATAAPVARGDGDRFPPVEIRVTKGRAPRASSGTAAAAAAPRKEKPRRKKEWEEMSLAEKAVELYVGEKGALFWLNKFAYASIFIMAGAWILFRFVGPSLGLYQFDAPPLAPTDVLRGS